MELRTHTIVKAYYVRVFSIHITHLMSYLLLYTVCTNEQAMKASYSLVARG